MISRLLTILAVTVCANMASAQGTPAPKAAEFDAFSASTFSFDETISFYNFDSAGTTTEFNQAVNWITPVKDLVAHLELPVYTNTVTGAGMLTLGATWQVLTQPCSFVDSFSVSVAVKFATSSAGFGGDSCNWLLKADAAGKMPVEKLFWSAGFSYEFNNGDYIPVFGGLVTDDIMLVKGGLQYEIMDKLQVGARYAYWYQTSDQTIMTLGPGCQYQICPNAVLDFSCDIPFEQYSGSDLDLVVSFGASIKF